MEHLVSTFKSQEQEVRDF